MVVEECFERCLIVFESKEGVDEGKLELLAAEVGINRLLGLAGGLCSAVLTLPELDVEIGVRRRVTVTLELIGGCIYEAGHVINAHLCRFLTVSILEAVST